MRRVRADEEERLGTGTGTAKKEHAAGCEGQEGQEVRFDISCVFS